MSNKSTTLFAGFGRKRRLQKEICAERERLYRIA